MNSKSIKREKEVTWRESGVRMASDFSSSATPETGSNGATQFWVKAILKSYLVSQMRTDKRHCHTCKDSKHLLPGEPSLGRPCGVCSYKQVGRQEQTPMWNSGAGAPPGRIAKKKTQPVSWLAGLERKVQNEEKWVESSGGRCSRKKKLELICWSKWKVYS